MTRTLRLGLLFLSGAICIGQQGFPLKQGDWEATTAMAGMNGTPMTMHFCFTDAEWIKGLTQNRSCKVDQFNVSSKGATYAMDCTMKSATMKGTVELKFDGMEHMTGIAAMTMTMNGKAMPANTVTEYHWKSSQCSANDLNLRDKK
jgi:hypothetical protein